MYLIKQTSDMGEMTATPPFGPAFTIPDPEGYWMAIYGSDFQDPGEDFTLFVLFQHATKIEEVKIPGY